MSHTSTLVALVEMNQRWLRQALDLLANVDNQSFSASPAGLTPHRFCSHLRHILEFYECFLEILESTHIDYDRRRRDLSVERSPAAAATRIRWLLDRLDSEPALGSDRVLFVRAEDAEGLGLDDPYLMSSVARELMTLSSHTVHHFALIAMTLRAHGLTLEADFGMAPSTLRHRDQCQAKALVAAGG